MLEDEAAVSVDELDGISVATVVGGGRLVVLVFGGINVVEGSSGERLSSWKRRQVKISTNTIKAQVIQRVVNSRTHLVISSRRGTTFSSKIFWATICSFFIFFGTEHRNRTIAVGVSTEILPGARINTN